MAPKRKAATGASEPPKKAKKQKRDSNVSTASSTSAKHPFKTALKAKLREIARGILETIDDPEEQALVNGELTKVAKSILGQLDELDIPPDAKFADAGEKEDDVDNTDLLEVLSKEVKEAESDLEEEEATLATFTKHAKEASRIARAQERNLHWSVKSLYSLGFEDGEDDSSSAWLHDAIAEEKEAIEQNTLPDELYDPDSDPFLKGLYQKLGPRLEELDRVTQCLDALDEVVDIGLSATREPPD